LKSKGGRCGGLTERARVAKWAPNKVGPKGKKSKKMTRRDTSYYCDGAIPH